jgi:hypothetical protein
MIDFTEKRSKLYRGVYHYTVKYNSESMEAVKPISMYIGNWLESKGFINERNKPRSWAADYYSERLFVRDKKTLTELVDLLKASQTLFSVTKAELIKTETTRKRRPHKFAHRIHITFNRNTQPDSEQVKLALLALREQYSTGAKLNKAWMKLDLGFMVYWTTFTIDTNRETDAEDIKIMLALQGVTGRVGKSKLFTGD